MAIQASIKMRNWEASRKALKDHCLSEPSASRGIKEAADVFGWEKVAPAIRSNITQMAQFMSFSLTAEGLVGLLVIPVMREVIHGVAGEEVTAFLNEVVRVDTSPTRRRFFMLYRALNLLRFDDLIKELIIRMFSNPQRFPPSTVIAPCLSQLADSKPLPSYPYLELIVDHLVVSHAETPYQVGSSCALGVVVL